MSRKNVKMKTDDGIQIRIMTFDSKHFSNGRISPSDSITLLKENGILGVRGFVKMKMF